MTLTILGIVASLVALIPLIIKVVQNRKVTREALARTEVAEIEAGMDRVDRATRPPGVQPPSKS